MNISVLFTQAPADDTSSSCTHAVVKVRRAKRDKDRTSESECDSGKENRRRSRIYKNPNSITTKVSLRETKDRRSDRYFCTCMWLLEKSILFYCEMSLVKNKL